MRGFIKYLNIRTQAFILILLLLSGIWRQEIIDFFNDHSVAESASCVEKKQEIAAHIASANSCTTDTDCMMPSFNCPFGCSSDTPPYINHNKREDLTKEVQAFNEACGYCTEECETHPKPVCVNGQCRNPS